MASISGVSTAGSCRSSATRRKSHGLASGKFGLARNPSTVNLATASTSDGRSLRPRRESATVYEVSDSSDSDEKSNGSNDAFEDEDEDEADEEEEEEAEEEPAAPAEQQEPCAERGTGTGKSLRPRNSLAAPPRLKEYVDTDVALSIRKRKKRKVPVKKKAGGRPVSGNPCKDCRESRRRCDKKKPRCTGCVRAKQSCLYPEKNDPNFEKQYDVIEGPSMRQEIRRSLEKTKLKRDAFYLKYRHLFEPLLTERNYITKLAEKKSLEVQGKLEDEKQEGVSITKETNEKIQPDAIGAPQNSQIIKPEESTSNVTESKRIEVIEVRDIVKIENNPIYGIKNEDGLEVVPYELLKSQPENVKAKMKPYQISGLSYMVWLYRNGASGILGDEMGLGKTLQTLSLFSYLTTYEPCPEGHHRPFLVICPLSVLSSWMSECKRWTPHLRALRFHGPSIERARLKKVAETGELFGVNDNEGEGRGYDVVVTSYEVFEREKAWFRRAFVWRYVVLDEGHKIKNEKANVSIALQGLAAEYRLILTGTPLQNNMAELWALLHWLYPDVFIENTQKRFSDAFNLSLGKNDINALDNARRLLELVMLRRMKESQGVNLGLPKKTELVMFLPLAPMQRFWYKRLLTRLDKGLLEGVFKNSKDRVEEDMEEIGKIDVGEHVVEEELNNIDEDQWGATRQIVEKTIEENTKDGGKWRKLMNLMMQLRKCCNHPYLLPHAEPGDDDLESHNSMMILASSKMIFLDKLVEELCMRQGKKVLIFTGFTRMLDVCEDFMHLKGGDGTRFKFGRLDGTTPRARRNLAIRLFNTDPSYKVMLISTRAGGLGINLASASDVVMLESDWNPQADLQAQARAHRIGQQNPVTIYRLVTQGTVEEQMMGRIRKKLYLSAKVTEAMRDIHTNTSSIGLNGDTETNLPTLSTGQLMSLVRSGSCAIVRPEIDPAEMLGWDWATTIQKCRDYQDQLENKDKTSSDGADEERRWLSEIERVETRVFEGKHHQKSSEPGSNHNIAKDWSREARRVGMNRVVIIDGHPVLKETVGNNEWEAVKTFAGTDPRLAEPPKRKKRAIEHQDYCQICFDGGVVNTCSGCPRTYHLHCLAPDFKQRLKNKSGQFYCPQHECAECEQKTSNAGGVIFRCRWCANGFCEDCMDWNNTQLLGESLPELEALDYGAIEQAFWIKCQHCIDHHSRNPEAKAVCDTMEQGWKQEAEHREAKAQAEAVIAKNGLLTMEGTTVEGSEVATPVDEAPPDLLFQKNAVNSLLEQVGKKRPRTMSISAGTSPRNSMAKPRPTKKSKAVSQSPQVIEID